MIGVLFSLEDQSAAHGFFPGSDSPKDIGALRVAPKVVFLLHSEGCGPSKKGLEELRWRRALTAIADLFEQARA